MYELPTTVVLFEFDETQYRAYALRCELVRMAEVLLGYGGCPVHWVRYSPDRFRVDGRVVEVSDAKRHGVVLAQLQRTVADRSFDHLITVATALIQAGGRCLMLVIAVVGGVSWCGVIDLGRWRRILCGLRVGLGWWRNHKVEGCL